MSVNSVIAVQPQPSGSSIGTPENEESLPSRLLQLGENLRQSFRRYFFPTRVLIIGGGPAGLAAAIVAKTNGCAVTILEKRSSYSREQYVAIESRPKFGLDFNRGRLKKDLMIRDLERLLSYHLEDTPGKSEIICGQFETFWEGKSVVYIDSRSKEKKTIAYDVIIAADGAHSAVRQALGIPFETLAPGEKCEFSENLCPLAFAHSCNDVEKSAFLIGDATWTGCPWLGLGVETVFDQAEHLDGFFATYNTTRDFAQSALPAATAICEVTMKSLKTNLEDKVGHVFYGEYLTVNGDASDIAPNRGLAMTCSHIQDCFQQSLEPLIVTRR